MPRDDRAPKPDAPILTGTERLQKVLAAAGVGSRRACEDLIFRRRVTVDGRVAQLGDKVDPATAVIHVDGERLQADNRLVYLAMNNRRAGPHGRTKRDATELSDFIGPAGQGFTTSGGSTGGGPVCSPTTAPSSTSHAPCTRC